MQKVKIIFTDLKKTHRIYLLQKIGHSYSELFTLVAETIGKTSIVPYNSVEGAVAILRQLSCGIHLEASEDVFNKIKQYIHKIWYVGKDSDEQALREFESELQMLEFLANLQKNDDWWKYHILYH